MIFQEPMTSLNPVFTLRQIAESIRLHQRASHEEALCEAKRMLDHGTDPGVAGDLYRVIRISFPAGCASDHDRDGAILPSGGIDCR
ncbi:Glutathione import ATP-binding protein GsiA [Salmonella enterica subsp. enterica]|nr:Glutathione import ATP-binding protein GsiA [Salmonella enterica subsp. enterica]